MVKKIFQIKTIKLVLLIFGIMLLGFLLYRADPKEILKTIAGAKINFLIVGFVIYLLLTLVRSLKWFLLFKKTGFQINYKNFLPFYLVNLLISNVSPFKSGEAVTPFIFKKYLKIPASQGFSVVILDRFFELIIFIFLLSLATLYIINAQIQNIFLLSVLKWIFLILFFFIILILIIFKSKKNTLKILNLSKKLSFAKPGLEDFYKNLNLFKGKKVYKFMIPLTLMGWLFEFLAFYFVFCSVLPARFLEIFSAQAISMAATFITFVPGGLGVGELGIIYILSLFGYSSLIATSGAFLARIFLTGTVFILGIIGSLLIKEKSQLTDNIVN
jgi:uncharacterized protein (TIRG00374 family)